MGTECSSYLFQSPTGQSGGSTDPSLLRAIRARRGFNPLRGNPVDLQLNAKEKLGELNLFQSPTGQSGGSTAERIEQCSDLLRFNPLRGNPVDLPPW